MTEEIEKPIKRLAWLKDINVLVGIGGVIATIIVGVVTYWLTTNSVSQEYQERIRAARNDVLTSVSRSIGEGVVPNKAKLQSVLNSVRRQYNIKEADFETPDTVIDDTLTRVLRNEFLDAKRREELAEKLMLVKNSNVTTSNDMKAEETTSMRLKSDSFFALIVSLITSMVAALTIVFMALHLKKSAEQRSRVATFSLLNRQVVWIFVIGLIFGFAIYLFSNMLGKDPRIFSFIFQRP